MSTEQDRITVMRKGAKLSVDSNVHVHTSTQSTNNACSYCHELKRCIFSMVTSRKKPQCSFVVWRTRTFDLSITNIVICELMQGVYLNDLSLTQKKNLPVM